MTARPTENDIKKWVRALRSGKYKQTTNTLHDKKGYCCLGVACAVFIPEEDMKYDGKYLYGINTEEQPHAPKWLHKINKLYHYDHDDAYKLGENISQLVDLNDDFRWTFNEIAAAVSLSYLEPTKKDFDTVVAATLRTTKIKLGNDEE